MNFVLATFAVLGLAAGCGSSSPSGTGGNTGGTGAGGRAATGGRGGAAGGVSGSAGSGGGGGAGGATAGQGGALGAAGAPGGGGTSTGGAAGGGGTSTGSAGNGSAGKGAAGAGPSGTGGVTTGGRAGSQGGAGGSPTGGAGGGTSGPGKFGVVALTESSTPYVFPAPIGAMTITAAGAVASFSLNGSGTSGCQTTTVGPCQLFTSCSSSSSVPGTVVDAGTVSVAGLNMPVPLNKIASTGGYISAAFSSYLWTASTPTTVTVTGSADVPAYTMSINAPNPVTLTAPTAGSVAQTGPTFTIARGTNLVATWTGGMDGTMQVNLQSGAAPNDVTVTCSVPASAGTVTIPASMMASLGTSGSFGANVTTAATKTVGDWLMDFQATVGVAQGTATFN